jgi:TetR/AcrR family transcriptional regulator, transcriptional repressor for nem operon
MGRPREFDEPTVVAAAQGAFWAHGYAGTSLADLMVATGLGKGSLYGAFGDKHGLFVRTFEEYCTDAVAGVEAQLTGDGPAYPRLVAHIRAVAESTVEDVERRGCFLAKSSAELAGTDEAVLERVRGAFTRLVELLTNCIADAQREGDLAADADPRRLAATVLATLRGIEALGKAGMDGDMLRGIGETAVALLPRV